MRVARHLTMLVSAILVTSCGGGGGGEETGPPPTYTVGGTISGLSGSGLVLNNNGSGCPICADLTVSAGAGTFTFPTQIFANGPYNVIVKAQPANPTQTCTVTGGSGTVTTSNVTSIAVNCTTNSYAVGGTVTGLTSSGLTLQLNGGTPLAVASGAGGFAFQGITSGTNYTVTIGTQPTGTASQRPEAAAPQNCTIANGTGTVGSANVTNIAITCVTVSYTLGGTVTGLAGSGLVLQNNGGGDLAIAAGSTAFTFPGTIASGSAYLVTVKTQPSSPSQTCTVANGSGTATANVLVAITCATNAFTIGGTVTGLTGTGLSLLLNGGTPLAVAAGAASFVFPGTVAPGTAYTVAVGAHPAGQTCTVAGGAGTVGTGNVTNVAVACTANAANTYTIGGTVTGLTSSGLTLVLNGGTALPVAAGATSFAFPAVASGTPYTVTIGALPSSQTCTLTNGSGTVGNANVTNVSVSCAVARYTIGGTITGLVGGGLSLTVNGGGRVNLAPGATAFTFLGTYPAGTAYTAVVSIQPSSPTQLCSMTNATGTVGTANVTNIVVSCGFSVGGTHGTTILRANGGVLLLNGGSPVDLVVDRPNFTFATPLPTGAPYAVTVGTQPSGPGHTCTVSNGNGIVGTTPITNVSVTCLPDGLIIAGAVSGYNTGTSTGLTLRINGGTPIGPQSKGRFAFPDFYSVGSEYRATIASQPTGPVQTCTLIRANGTMPPPTDFPGVTNLNVQCTTNATSSLSGTYSTLIGGKRTFLTFWPDGTYVLATRLDDASCGANGGNGVEYGVYNWNSATGAFSIRTGHLDTNGGCGLWDGVASPAVGFSGTLTRSGSTLSLTDPGGTFVFTAVTSTPSSVVGAWQQDGDANGTFVVFLPDNTYVFVETQSGTPGVTGVIVGHERGCYSATASTVTFSLAGSCLPDGGPAFDLNGKGGVSESLAVPIPFVITGPNSVTFGGDTFLARLLPN